MENDNTNQGSKYESLMSDIIAKQKIILGPEIAVLKARGVAGIEISDQGEVVSITGDPREALEQLIDEYVNLSGQIVKSALSSVFLRYPDLIKVDDPEEKKT